MKKENNNPRLFWDPVFIYLGIHIGIPLLIIAVLFYAEAIETHPIISSVITVIVVCTFGILWFLRKLSK